MNLLGAFQGHLGAVSGSLTPLQKPTWRDFGHPNVQMHSKSKHITSTLGFGDFKIRNVAVLGQSWGRVRGLLGPCSGPVMGFPEADNLPHFWTDRG